jgi:hypothetical protein
VLNTKDRRTNINKTLLGNGFLLIEIIVQHWDGSAWVNRDKSSTTYDVNNNPIEEIGQTWNSTAWVISDKYLHTYAPITAVNEGLNSVNSYTLSNNYPNPFNPSTTFEYSIHNQSRIIIKVFNILGNEIETLVNEEKPAGTYEVKWNAVDLPSGVYFYSIHSGYFEQTMKMLLLK